MHAATEKLSVRRPAVSWRYVVIQRRDPESAATVVVRPRELARTYAATVQREIAAWRAACRRLGIDYHHVTTDLPFGMALRLLA